MMRNQGERPGPGPQTERLINVLIIIALSSLYQKHFNYTVEHSDSMTCAEI